MTKAVDELEIEIRDCMRAYIADPASRQTAVSSESHTYSTGTLAYTLANSKVSRVSSVTGTVSGSPHTFEWNTDYTWSDTTLTFTSSGTKPDDATAVSVTYYYGRQWIMLGAADTNIGVPFVEIRCREYTGDEYLDNAVEDRVMSAEIEIFAHTASQRNTLSNYMRDLFHDHITQLSFYHVTNTHSDKDIFTREAETIRGGTKAIKGFHYVGIFDFTYKLTR